MPDDPRVDDYAQLTEPELMRSRGLFVAEGRLVVRRVIQDGRFVVRSLLLSEPALHALENDLRALAPDVPVYLAPSEDFARITGIDVHRGCLALVERPANLQLDEVIRHAATVVILEGVANPDNVGGVFRNVLALGGDCVLLDSACCDPLYRKAVRTSMGAVFAVPFARFAEWPGCAEALRRHAFTIVALTPLESAPTLEDFAKARPSGPVALVVGKEGTGLTDAAAAAATCAVRIPMRPGVDSLNLAVAAGIALHRLARPQK